MGELRKTGRLQISDDLSFTKASWKVERAGWLALAALIAAGMLGLLGPGLFSAASAGEIDDPLRVEFERFGHFETEDELTVHLKTGTRNGLACVWIEDRYLDHVEIRQIHPPPSQVRLQDGRKVYSFPLAQESDRTRVRFDITYKKVGRLAGRLGTPDGPSVEVRQFVYP